jgi:hypothetical protein
MLPSGARAFIIIQYFAATLAWIAMKLAVSALKRGKSLKIQAFSALRCSASHNRAIVAGSGNR